METQGIILVSILIPVVAALLVFILPSGKVSDRTIAGISIAALILTLSASLLLLYQYHQGQVLEMTLFELTKNQRIYLKMDALGAFFLAFIPFVWLLAGIFSLEYLHHEQNRKRFWGFYLLTLTALIGLCAAGNLITMYFFFEMMTLFSMPLVLHTQTHEAIIAGLKYLLYSMCGAYMALFGTMVFVNYTGNGVFEAGGILRPEIWGEHRGLILLAAFFMILGFGVKAGMFPMHAWLPTAHPVAPAPASAVLSAIIVKGGVLCVIRSIYYVVGADLIRGTWVQYTWIILAMITVFLGSMLAYGEKVLKKRLAYSSVSQASYIMLGLAVLTPAAMTGSLLHVLFHAFIKTALFLTAGAIIYKTGKTRVDELRGIGKEMPITIWCYTFVSLALIGIPPASGFISKWYLATGILDSRISVVSWLGPVILLVSALLTAGYLLPITIQGFLPGADFDYQKLEKKEPSPKMDVPLMILAAAALLTGLFPGRVIAFVQEIAMSVL